MQSIFSNKVLWGIVITFIISGLAGISGLVSPHAALWITFIMSALTGLGHTTNLIKGA